MIKNAPISVRKASTIFCSRSTSPWGVLCRAVVGGEAETDRSAALWDRDVKDSRRDPKRVASLSLATEVGCSGKSAVCVNGVSWE